MKLTLYGRPITKKNSMQIISCGGRPRLIQSKAFREYEKICIHQIDNDKTIDECFLGKVEVACMYYLKDKRKTDLTNLLAATHDILQKAEIIKDDALIISLDGSRIAGYDKENPRVEIVIKAVG